VLVPQLGKKRLDTITDEDVQSIKAALADHAPKTVNNVLTVLGSTLRVAVKWKVLPALPCAVDLVKVCNLVPEFYEFGDYGRLVDAAGRIDRRTLLIVLLGGDAGLRRGEMIGLRWADVDFRRRQLKVEQAVWGTVTDAPKSGRGRIIPMTDALARALHEHRHLRGEHVLYADDGRQPQAYQVRKWLKAAQRRAGFAKATGGTHVLRHTFCSHLAMRGAPAKAIQELAGHESLTTTMRYMHLSPRARAHAIGLLNDRREEGQIFGEIVETAGPSAKIS
jgi:integrase